MTFFLKIFFDNKGWDQNTYFIGSLGPEILRKYIVFLDYFQKKKKAKKN